MDNVNTIKNREDIPERYKWNIKKVYENNEEFEKYFKMLKEIAPKLKEYQGKLNDSNKLLEYLKLDEKVSRLAEKLYVYAHCKLDENTANTTQQAIKSNIEGYFAELGNYKAFFVPELLSLDENAVLDGIKKAEELKIYEFYIKDILKLKPHVLGKEQEELLALVSDCMQSPENIFSMLTNADITFPNIKDENNNEVPLTEENYSIYIRSKNREVRKQAFNALFTTYAKYKNTIAASLSGSVKNFVFNSKIRKYKSALESSLKPNNIPLEVYDNTIDTVNKNLSSLHRYVRIKKKLLNLEDIHMYDLYVPIIDTPDSNIEFQEGVNLALEGLKVLGEDYLEIFKKGINDGWIDIYENKGKRGGAYSSGCYDTMPYILLNYNNKLNDVSTLVHEMGHSIHSYYSRKTQPYIYADYTLFCAEVASTTNECLLINYLIEKEQDKNKKLFLINQQLEQIRTTVFRQVMFAEFEKIIHEKIETGNALTSSDLCGIWHDLNIKYFGPDMVIDEEIDIEWARIPHFYWDFYVYQYATGYAAANSFAENILTEGKTAAENYKNFLKSGGSDYPINLLKKAGVDMTTPKPLEDTINRFNELLDMLENIDM
ncbi:oligoendopeptidase F, plasmid [Clostridium acetireducens DSM 10703]|uniref:Oligopeptidase F n=1 Tax=Clostridium acetireducens DSM 10703 TaxID=1121290 RepID=A0A1E8EXQ8_9CLOT|nr:oligoendopeptidase F [Clostridium acetireducens]OFI05558.1 oligoendopeptidase F, plasmid [Clostridium acetireducens DSM 10703]